MTPGFALLALSIAARPVPVPPPPPPDQPKEAPPVDQGAAVAPADPAMPAEATPSVPPAPVPTPVAAPSKPPDEKLALTFGELRLAPRAQLRVRGEVVGDKTLAGAYPAYFVTHRARGGFDVEWKDTARAVMELQDVRAWGAERSPAEQPPDVTLFGKITGSIDLHQAFAAVFLGPVELRVGRQEISFSNERVLGGADWVQAGRAFDAVAVSSRQSSELGYLAFCSLVRNRDHLPGAATDELTVCGGGVEHKIAPFFRYAPVAIVELSSAAQYQRATVGARVDGGIAGFSYDVDAFGQVPMVDGVAKAAFLVGARAAYELDTMLHPKIGLLADFATGGDPASGAVVTFDTTYGTNHKFYGYQDLFLNLPLHTLKRGLFDGAATFSVKEGPFSGQLAVHAFAPTAYAGVGPAFYGVEPDLLGRYDLAKFLALQAGGSLFVPVGPALGRGNQVAPWVFVMIDLKL